MITPYIRMGTYVETIISVKYDRCDECIGSLFITTY